MRWLRKRRATPQRPSAYPFALRKTLAGVNLAARHVEAMPRTTHAERMAATAAMMDGLRVMKMGEWRPTFPYGGELRAA